VKAEAMSQPSRGVTGVPHFFLDRGVSDGRYAVPGAQDEATWTRVLDKIAPRS
jgi:predicted DsbA family dithiol-disulfide isomerase